MNYINPPKILFALKIPALQWKTALKYIFQYFVSNNIIIIMYVAREKFAYRSF